MEDSFEEYMNEDVSRLLERYRRESACGSLGFYDVDEYVSLIDAYIWYADFAKAKEVLEMAQGQYPQAVELKLKQAEICLETDLFEQALLLLQEVEAVEPYLYDCHIVKGHTLICMNRLDEARASFSRALEEGADEVDVAMGLARVEIEAHDTAKAWVYMQQIIGTEEDNIETCNRFIDLAQKGNLLPDAMELVRKLLKDHPYRLLYWKTLIELADCASCYEQAIEACEFALAIAPDDMETLKNKFCLLENVDTDESQLDFYLQLEKLAAEKGEEMSLRAIWLRIAQEYEMDSLWQEAKDYYSRLVDFEGVRQYALFRLGVMADFLGDYTASIAYFKQALDERAEEVEEDNRDKIYRAMGRTYFNMGQVEEGLKYSRMAVDEAPQNRYHRYAYLLDCYNKGAVKDGDAYLEEAFQTEISAGLMLAKAVFYYYRGRKEESYALFTMSFAMDRVALKDMAALFRDILLEDVQVREVFTNAAGNTDPMESAMDDNEPFFYYGPDIHGHLDYGDGVDRQKKDNAE